MDGKKDGYSLSRQWFDFAFENPEKVTPTHGILWFWLIELNNRLGWKEKFGLPTAYSMDAIGVSNYRTYKKAMDDLIKWGFVILIAKAKNQHTASIVALVKNTKAIQKHCRGTASIDKHNKTIKTGINSTKFENFINYQKPKANRIYRE